ncbi:MAG: hypothetical protein AMXMBFR84_38230 [Candidatus Hydrogenedentota bacterium]
MPRLIKSPSQVMAAGQPPKIIREYIGRVNSATHEVSIAYMSSPAGWMEPGQTPEFNEYTLVLKGTLRVASDDDEVIEVHTGEAVIVPAGEWVQYSTCVPTEYIAVCVPGFSMDTVHRDDE